ncbi:MAG: peptidylprolyl isomerase [Planctomycetales bacterium]|nr:peptidylprolyl isomerase [Planctomycetales bacterium]
MLPQPIIMGTRMTRHIYSLARNATPLPLLLLAVLVGCGGEVPTAHIEPPGSTSASTEPEPADSDGGPTAEAVGDSPTATQTAAASAEVVRVELVLAQGRVLLELFPQKAPSTVHNFMSNYVDLELYNNSLIHYVDENILIGGGFGADRQPTSTRWSVRNESNNGLSNVRGTVAMSRDPSFPDSATSQFFVNLTDNPHFDHQDKPDEVVVGGNGYCVFGRVVEGMEILDALAKVPTTDVDDFVRFPVEPIVVQTFRRLQ